MKSFKMIKTKRFDPPEPRHFSDFCFVKISNISIFQPSLGTFSQAGKTASHPRHSALVCCLSMACLQLASVQGWAMVVMGSLKHRETFLSHLSKWWGRVPLIKRTQGGIPTVQQIQPRLHPNSALPGHSTYGLKQDLSAV